MGLPGRPSLSRLRVLALVAPVGASGDGAFFVFFGQRAGTRLTPAVGGERVRALVAHGFFARRVRGS